MSGRRINGMLYSDDEYLHARLSAGHGAECADDCAEHDLTGPQWQSTLPPPVRGSLSESIVKLRSVPMTDELADALAWRD